MTDALIIGIPLVLFAYLLDHWWICQRLLRIEKLISRVEAKTPWPTIKMKLPKVGYLSQLWHQQNADRKRARERAAAAK